MGECKLLTSTLLATLLATVGCGAPTGELVDVPPVRREAVYGGVADTRNAYPETGWIAAASRDGVWACTGTLVARDKVLTAGHCLGESFTMVQWMVFVPHPRPLPLAHRVVYRVVRAARHPLYDNGLTRQPLLERLDDPESATELAALQELEQHCGSFEKLTPKLRMCAARLPASTKAVLGINDIDSQSHDVAVLTLDRAVRHGSIGRLPVKGDGLTVGVRARTAGDEAAGLLEPRLLPQLTSVGYGLTDQRSIFLDTLGRRMVGTVQLEVVGPHELHAVHGATTIMPGDSGGPVFHQMPDGGRTIVGVASRVFLDVAQYPAMSGMRDMIFVRVAPYMPWIDAQLAD